ncbi:MAG TPA: ubiquitin-like small modifier protein 1 [Thermoanaerobaculia bacterium]|nr:ubiquitin-like small modifier protein 1 [Thermoanaerobaculia bacterium]
MSYVIFIPGPLREYAGNRGEVRISGQAKSVADALSLLWTQYPAVRDRVITELGDVRPHVNIFVDGESIRDSAGLRTEVRDGAEIFILPAVSGG